ncbi:MAG: hypothetical protein DMD81_10785 [Candidatus Rokuibacteriota bacterium]|nr:MAG: hypothetical protein DMD81_10785 [Candidatus Rokubacteria bacterium]
MRAALADAAADDSISRRAATIVLSAMYWRNTWKYESRGYRHLFWDSGTMLANLLACGDAMGLAPRVLTGFVDTAVNRLLGLDVRHEAALELVPLGPETAVAPVARALPPIQLDVVPLSSSEVDYPALRDMHEASMLDSAAAVDHWRTGRLDDASPRSRSSGRTVAAHDREGNRSSAVEAHLVPLPAATREAGRGLGDTIQRRGSTREFGEAPLSLLELATTLWCATRPWDSDAPSGLVDVFLVANAVDGLTSGAYRYRPDAHALEIVREGAFRNESAYLCLEQPLGGDAAAVIYFLAPLDAILAARGNRGYRLANLEAGVMGGRAYLAAYAQGFGASGLTFYDRHVVEFFAPASAGEDAIFVTALGRSRMRVRSEEAKIPVISRLRRQPS